jgi:hypothetical protein
LEITYQLQRDDLLILTDELHKRSPTVRGIVRRTMVTTFLTAAMLCWGLWILTGQTVVVVTTFVVSMILVALMPLRLKRNQRRAAASFASEGRNRAMFLPTTLSVDRDSLSWSNESGSGTMKFEYLERVSFTDTHLLIYLNVRYAYVVARESVQSGDFDAFGREVERRWKSAMDLIAEPHEAYST